jgi:hypothetical protein
METNNITVDLNTHLVIPIKEPFDKKQLAHFVADCNDYDNGIQKVEHKLFEGSFDEFQKFAKGKENIQVIQVNNDSVNYQEVTNQPHEISKTEFGISKYLQPSTDALIKMLTEAQIKQAEADIENAKANLELQKKAIEEQLSAIRDISLK